MGPLAPRLTEEILLLAGAGGDGAPERAADIDLLALVRGDGDADADKKPACARTFLRDKSQGSEKYTAMPSRGRHQSTSKECRRMIEKIEAIDGVVGVIIGMSYGGKSLGKNQPTGAIKIQRIEEAGLKAATQSAKGLQELFIRTENGREEEVARKIKALIR